MGTWPVKRMDELCEITSSKRIFAADYVAEGVPFYRGREITENSKGNLDVSTELFITEEKFREIERKSGAPKTGDLLLTSVGTLGSVYVVNPGDRFYFKDGNLTWFRNFRGLDSRFLYYWLGSPQGKAELQKATIGSSQSAFTIVLLKGMEMDLPPLPVQRRIAGILSAYDELMENSQRRIRILEAMARALYREWFIHFRYPGSGRETGSEPSTRPSGHPSPSGRRAGDEGARAVAYKDVAGLCKAATLKEVEAQGWSLNPGRYVGVAAGVAVSDEDFKEQLETLNEELETLNAAARELEATIANNVTEILEA